MSNAGSEGTTVIMEDCDILSTTAEMPSRECGLAESLTQAIATMSPDLSYDEWLSLGQRLQATTKHIQFLIGDWLNHGEARYGAKYTKAVEQLGINLKTAQQYAWLAREYQGSRRLELSWSHHQAAAGVEKTQREKILDSAVANKWSVSRLRQEVKPVRSVARQSLDECEESIRNEMAAICGISRRTADKIRCISASGREEELFAQMEQDGTSLHDAYLQVATDEDYLSPGDDLPDSDPESAFQRSFPPIPALADVIQFYPEFQGVHAACLLIPIGTRSMFWGIVDGIRKRGQRFVIRRTADGMLLDGWEYLLACHILKMPIRIEDEEPWQCPYSTVYGIHCCCRYGLTADHPVHGDRIQELIRRMEVNEASGKFKRPIDSATVAS